MNSTETDGKNTKNIDAVLKIYPYIGKSDNRKGYYIGDLKVALNSTELPFNNLDQVDYTISNLYNYSKIRKNPKDFFKNYTQKINYVPVSSIKVGGSKKYRKTMKKLKKPKNSKKSKKSKKSYKKLQ